MSLKILKQLAWKNITSLSDMYESTTGVKMIRDAHEKVIQAEASLTSAQKEEDSVRLALRNVQNQLRSIHSELEKVSDDSEQYVEIITRKARIIREQNQHLKTLSLSEREKRDSLTLLSSSIRENFEKRKLQAEKSKNISIIATVIGASLGFLGGILTTRMRSKELRKISVTVADESSKISNEIALCDLQLNSIKDDVAKCTHLIHNFKSNFESNSRNVIYNDTVEESFRTTHKFFNDDSSEVHQLQQKVLILKRFQLFILSTTLIVFTFSALNFTRR